VGEGIGGIGGAYIHGDPLKSARAAAQREQIGNVGG
jgi:hypothetical protein